MAVCWLGPKIATRLRQIYDEDGGFPDVIVEDEVVNSGGNGSEFAALQKMPANEAGNTATRVYRPGRHHGGGRNP